MSETILAPRMRQCLSLAKSGKTSPEIAAELRISRRTVDQYFQMSFDRLGARNRAHAVAEAMRLGEI